MIFSNFDFSLLEQADFKEDSVREFIIAPLLADIGFALKNDKKPQSLEIVLSKTLNAQIQIGSNKKFAADLTPDYLLFVNQKPHCVLDAKAPKIDISKGSPAQKQALSYMLAVECELYALCNGKKLIVFNARGVVLELDLAQLSQNEIAKFQQLFLKESPHDFQTSEKKSDEWYLKREIPNAILKPKKQAKKRHYGCTMYFTRQSWDIVTSNIKAFTAPGDVVLDSFGGSGVTAIEAMVQGRVGIHVDLNPLSVFMVKAVSAKVNVGNLWDLGEEILKEFEKNKPKNEKEAKRILKSAQYYPNAMDKEFGEIASAKKQDETLWIPQDEILPKGSDVPSVLGLFSPQQLAELALLRKLIFQHTTPSGTLEQRTIKRNLRYSLMLAFYNALIRCNLTFHRATSLLSLIHI